MMAIATVAKHALGAFALVGCSAVVMALTDLLADFVKRCS